MLFQESEIWSKKSGLTPNALVASLSLSVFFLCGVSVPTYSPSVLLLHFSRDLLSNRQAGAQVHPSPASRARRCGFSSNVSHLLVLSNLPRRERDGDPLLPAQPSPINTLPVSVAPARAADKSVGSNEESHIPTKTTHACPDASIPSISNTVASEPYIKSLY